MAYGSWSSEKETQFWKNSNFKCTVKWDYRQDPVANKTEYRTKKVKVYAVNSYDSFYNDSAVAGAAVITETRKTQKVNASIPKGGSQEFNVTDDSRSFSHQADGTMPTVNYNVHGYFDAGLGGDYGTPTGGWKVKAINSHISKIDRATGTTTVSVSSKTYNSITVKLSTVHHSKPTGRYRLNGGSWVNFSASADVQKSGGGSQSLTISGLSPNTAYTIEAQYQRVHNELWNVSGAAGTRTKKPNLPTVSSLSLVSKTYNSVTVKMGGSYGAGHPSGVYGYYRAKLSTHSSWTTVSNNTSHTISGLSPNTTYTVQAQLVDYYGQASSTKTLSVTTNKPSAPTVGNPTVSSVTYNSATISLGTSTPGAGGSVSKYQISYNNSSWTDVSFPYKVTGLSPNNQYTRYVRCVDNYGTPSSSKSVSFKTSLPNKPSGGRISVSNVTINSAKMSYSGFIAGTGGSIARYDVCIGTSQDSWINNGLNTSYTRTGLRPDTDYTAYVRAVDNYGQSSPTITSPIHTPKPNYPSSGDVEVSEITINSAKFTWTGFSFADGSTWGRYEYSLDGTKWTSTGQETTVVVTGLIPETEYTFHVRLVDNFNQASEISDVVFTTLIDQVKAFIKQNGAFKKGKVWIKHNGAWKKVKKMYVKDGSWKKGGG